MLAKRDCYFTNVNDRPAAQFVDNGSREWQPATTESSRQQLTDHSRHYHLGIVSGLASEQRAWKGGITNERTQ